MATDLDGFWPFDSGTGALATEDRWRSMARHWLQSGVLRNEDNTLQLYADSSGLQVKVKTGKIWLRGAYGENIAEKIIPIAANASGLTRIDRVVARNDFVNNKIVIDVVQGTPGGAAPAVTQNAAMWEQSLGQVSIPNADASIDAGQVTDERIFAVPRHGAGGVLSKALQTATANSASAVDVDLPGMTVTFFAQSGRRYRAKARVNAFSSVNADDATFKIKVDGATATHANFTCSTNGDFFEFEVEWDGVEEAALAEGVHTVKVSVNRLVGTGTIQAFQGAASQQNSVLVIEDLGPV